MKSGDYINFQDENLQLSRQAIYIYVQISECLAWEKKNKITILLWPPESWLEFDWKSMTITQSSKNCQLPKPLQELERITIEGLKKISENTCANLIKKLSKTIAASLKDERPWYWQLLLWKKFIFSIFHTVRIIWSFPVLFIFLLIFCKFNLSLFKLIFIFFYYTL